MKPILLLRENNVTKMIEMVLHVLGYACLFAEELAEEDGSRAIIDLESLGVFGESSTLALAQRMLHGFPEYDLLFLTTNVQVAASLKHGGYSVLTKPFHLRNLAAWVAEGEQKDAGEADNVLAARIQSL